MDEIDEPTKEVFRKVFQIKFPTLWTHWNLGPPWGDGFKLEVDFNYFHGGARTIVVKNRNGTGVYTRFWRTPSELENILLYVWARYRG